MTLAWADASGAVDGYAVFVQRNGGDFRREQTVSSNRVSLAGAPGETARIVVAAFDTTGNLGPGSTASPEFSFPEVAAPQVAASTASPSLVTPAAAIVASASGAGAEGSRDTADAGTDAVSEVSADADADALSVERLAGAFLWRADGALRVTDSDLHTLVLATAPPEAELLGAADFDGDGAGDLLWSDGETLSYTPLAQGAPTLDFGRLEAGESVIAVGDFDADGAADLLLRAASGELGVWLTGAGAPAETLGEQGDAQLAAVSDFDGDGSADLVWQEADGALSLWLMRGTRPHASLELLSDSSLEVSGAGDFDGDGAAELALRDASGALFVHEPLTNRIRAAGNADPAQWSPVGSADVNGDGRDDLVLVGDGALLLASLPGATQQALDPASPWELVALLP